MKKKKSRRNLIKQIEEIIARIKREYKVKYDPVIIDVWSELNQPQEELILRGRVLLPAQRDRIVKSLREKSSFKIIDHMVILSDPAQLGRTTLNWGKAGQEIVGVRRKKGSGELATQLIPEDNPFRILIRDGKQYLIQLDDLTLGWVYEDEVVLLGPSLENPWEGIRRPGKGELIEVAPGDLNKLINTALKYVETTPYLRGGRSRQGLDCSGLIQVAFKNALDLVLPKHALDQMKLGQRVTQFEGCPGDLVFAKVIGRNIVHVGLLLTNGEKKIIHSCLSKGKVVAESPEGFLKNYKPVGYRRLIKKVR